MKPLKDFISRILESNYYVDYSDNVELLSAIEQYAAQFKLTPTDRIEGENKR
jgi:hypothetical protein